MKIGFDLLPLQSDPKRRGISNFVYNLLGKLINLDKVDDYYLFNAKNVNLEFVGAKIPKNRIFLDEITPEKSRDLDLFVVTSIFDFEKKIADIKRLKCKKAVIVYDLIPLIFWDNYISYFPEKIKEEYFRRLGKIYDFDRIITISESAKDDISDLLEINKSKIDVIYAGFEGIDAVSEEQSSIYDIKKRYSINRDYIFSVPSMDYRKNIKGMIKAYGLLPKEIKEKYQLVITCELTSEFEKRLREIALPEDLERTNIIFTNYIDDKTLKKLYIHGALFIFPSFYEGFGLPVLEAMSCGLPVITSNNSSLSEIAEEAAILVDPNDIISISETICAVLRDESLRENLKKRGIAQSKKFSWERTALLAIESFHRIYLENEKHRIGMVTTWNVKCGIAEYTKYLLEKSPDIEATIFANYVDPNRMIDPEESNVVRCWNAFDDDLNKLYDEIVRSGLNTIHIQFNFGFFDLSSLANLINKLYNKNIKSMITFHATQDVVICEKLISLRAIVATLGRVDKILIHSQKDNAYLKQFGLNDNLVLMPQGYKVFENRDKSLTRSEIGLHNSRVISNFGFLLPHKGVLETIRAISILKEEYKDILFLVVSAIYPEPVSQNYLIDCRKEVEILNLNSNVLFITDYLKEDEIIELLHASDVLVLPYTETKESSSASIRFALSSSRPTIVTDLPIFSEFDREVWKISKSQPEIIAKAIDELFKNEKLQEELIEASKQKVESESWELIAERYRKLVSRLT